MASTNIPPVKMNIDSRLIVEFVDLDILINSNSVFNIYILK